MFNVKTKAEIHKKLIEVFSFRNDISQRKSIIEEVFTLLLSKQRFEIPQHLTLRKQEDILMYIRKLPDYHVYKAHKNFEDQLEKLAEKQLKEEALIDSISYRESMTVSRQDIQSYLHLFNHDRLKEFVHFKPAIENFDELDKPIPETILREAVLREKTLNTVIYQLTR
jgi:FKBP-type peptidyl-prolyl cis-trans isomerase (trigger factor)